MGGKKKQTVGYKYHVGMHMAFSHGPVDKLLRIDVGDREAWSGSSTGGRITIDEPELFGGEKREGGIQGDIDFEPGDANQAKNDYLVDVSSGRVSANRGVAGVVLRQPYIGNNPYLKPWAFLCQRIHRTTRTGATQWYDAKAQIGQDMNPAHIIRECLTDRDWGMSYSPSDMGASFTAAADTLYSEGFGMSLLWDRAVPIEDFLREILQTIDGTLYVDIRTGLFELALSRDDYDPDNLPVLDESNVISVQDFKRKTNAEIVNSVTLKFWNQDRLDTDSVQVHDIALIAMMGAQVGTVLNYDGITDPALAAVVATRELRTLSKALASVTLTTTRAVDDLQIGSVFAFEWPRLGVGRAIMRVVEAEYGNLTDGKITIKAVEDVFATPEPAIAAPVPTEWVVPNNPPAAVPTQVLYEANYFDIAQAVGDDVAATVDPTAAYVLVAAEKPTPDAYGATMHYGVGGGYTDAGTTRFCAFAELEFAIGYTDTTIAIEHARNISLVGLGAYAYIDDELVRIDAVSSSSITVGRGCLDTVPIVHSAGAPVVFAGEDAGVVEQEFAVADSVSVRVTPFTGLGELPVANAPTANIALQGRQDMPYAPGNVRVNSVAYPPGTVSGTVTISWAHRDRLQQTAPAINDTTAGDIGPEPGVEYTIEIRRGGSVVESQSSIAGTSYVMQAPTPGTYNVRLRASRDGVDSWQEHDFDFVYA